MHNSCYGCKNNIGNFCLLNMERECAESEFELWENEEGKN